ncbi:DUF2185 domain-containing protein [Paenibacillus sp. CGMCC 1.16610]|uniref:DUF2185 domain-containing protein n=1 Tax=Paenibacillus anseongense TaxID=2682845 RepID=A0ABW9TZV4_9BACL|nr:MULTISPECIES: DUF2185 domain-containing protein [Paenibacillus]MBA2937056.1 DUF2185 domain-containing protein [Paenibacillus sp. CGMCC 1.16610]MVQ33379.1 DUF2185 domain-containing protein [Paenibacillus anseongense]
MLQPWPFDDPENVAVITTNKIMNRERPIQYVTHDEDDGMWQFLDDGEVKEEEARIISLKQIINIDPSLIQLSDLPLGWVAWRDKRDSLWIREKK